MMPSAARGQKKPGILLWRDLNIEQLCALNESADKLGTLGEIFRLTNYKHDLKSAILLDLYFYTLQFSEKRGFNDEQTSAFFSIIKSVHERAVDTPYGNVDDAYKYFKELLLCHSVKRPPFSIQLFSADQVQLIADYTINTYFKHYKLYKYAFTSKVRLDLTFEYSDTAETPTLDEDEQEVNNEEREKNLDEVNTVIPNISETAAEDSPAIKELKGLITATLTEQVNKLRLNVEEQLKASNETLSQKFGFACGSTESPKSPKPGNKRKGK